MPADRFDIFLRRVYEATGINSQNELALAMHINRSAITQARKKNAVPEKWLLQLYRLFNLNPDWLESGKGPTFLKPIDGGEDDSFTNIPKVKARLCAGDGSFEVGSEIEGYYAFRNEWLYRKGKSNSMVLLDIFGNSMAPELRDGDTVLIDESQKDVLAGALYAVGIDDAIMVKRLEKHPGKLALLSDNRDYEPIFLTNHDMAKARIIGKVIWSCREFR
jgi:phage repressor protein C with HTH and peptisase S24 domain